MNWRVIIRPNAEADLQEAQAWYESRRVGLGEELLDEVRRTVRLLESDPERRPRYCLSHLAREAETSVATEKLRPRDAGTAEGLRVAA